MCIGKVAKEGVKMQPRRIFPCIVAEVGATEAGALKLDEDEYLEVASLAVQLAIVGF